MTSSLPKIYANALSYLARREHSQAQLRQKLKLKFPDEAANIETVLAQLAEEHYQSEPRFADSYIRSRIARGYGPIKIAYELKLRGIAQAVISDALARAEVDWAEIRETVRQKKFGAEPLPKEFSARAKQLNYLQQRGFDSL